MLEMGCSEDSQETECETDFTGFYTEKLATQVQRDDTPWGEGGWERCYDIT